MLLENVFPIDQCPEATDVTFFRSRMISLVDATASALSFAFAIVQLMLYKIPNRTLYY